MEISFDAEKRRQTLEERGLDFADAGEVFTGLTYTIIDARKDYGETRLLTFGLFRGRLVSLAWTPRGETRRIISMRYANDREKRRFEKLLGSSEAKDEG